MKERLPSRRFRLERGIPGERHSFVSPKLELRSSQAGDGLFAREAIAAGECVVDFSTGPGTYIDLQRAQELFDEGNDYMIQVDDGKFFAAASSKELEVADFVNHSCDPNCGIRGALALVALRDIAPEEQITFDYAMSESSDYEMPCRCGSPHCRGVVTGNDWKLPALQERYRGRFSDYLQRRIDQAG